MQMPNLTPEPGSFFDRILTFVLANLMFFLFAVLIIPMPAATAGLFAVLAPLVRGRDAEIFATFFGTMRRQWRKSTLIVLADVAIAALLALNFSMLGVMDLPAFLGGALRSIYIFVSVAVLLANLYMWPLLVLFDLDLRRLATVSLRLAFTHAVWSFFTLLMALLPLIFVFIAPPLISAVVVFSTSVLIINWGTWRVIKQYATLDELAGLDRP